MKQRRRRKRGKVERLGPGPETAGLDRSLTVYLPPSYARSTRHYPVVYLQDGQNLFDPEESFAGSWRVDIAMDHAAARGFEGIAIGIHHSREGRLTEYSPFDDPDAGPGSGREYVTYLAQTIKPLVDARYRTIPGRGTTCVAGSSMGGLISLFAFLARPDVFGAVAAMSPSLWYADRAILEVVAAAPFRAGRIYLDVGQREGEATLDDTRRLRDLLLAKGYRKGDQLRYVEDREGGHEEAAWGHRLRAALPFLLAPPG